MGLVSAGKAVGLRDLVLIPTTLFSNTGKGLNSMSSATALVVGSTALVVGAKFLGRSAVPAPYGEDSGKQGETAVLKVNIDIEL